MASIKNLKKDINYVLGDVITYTLDIAALKNKVNEGNDIVDETIDVFDELIAKVNASDVENSKKHFRTVKTELQNKATSLIEKANSL
jgi:two-component SAPR family response regulator